MLTEKPRSVRNNNPGNLRDFGLSWHGQTGVDEQGYCTFETAVKGFRALALDLRTKWAKDKLRDIAAIITKFAPASDNNPTAAYIENVSKAMGVAADAPLNLDDGKQLGALCRAIAVQEAGAWLFGNIDLSLGVYDALHPAGI